MLHDVLRKANLLSSDCEDELKFELLQRVSIEFFEINHVAFFDPALANACSADIRQHCPGLNPGNSQVHFCLSVFVSTDYRSYSIRFSIV